MSAAPEHANPLLELFAADARQAATKLSHGLALISEGGAKPASVLPELVAAARAVRSAARIVNLEAPAQVALALENRLRGIGEMDAAPDADLAAALLAGAEAIQRIGSTPPPELAGFGRQHAEYLASVLSMLGSTSRKRATSERPYLVLASNKVRAAAPPAIDTGMLAIFKTEAENCVAALNAGVVQLEAGDHAALEPLMRAAHSFKGALRVVGFEGPTRLAHALEDCFVSAQRRSIRLTRRHVDLLLQAVDLLSELASSPVLELARWEVAHGSRALTLASALTSLAEGRSSAPPPPPAPDRKLSERAEPPLGDRVLRVTASSINRLMGLAGESLVESRRVQSLAGAALRLKRQHAELGGVLEKLDALASSDAENAGALVRDVKARAVACRDLLGTHLADLEAHARRSDDLSDRLYREALKSRMRPFRDGVQGLPRAARDTARQLDKQVRLELVGEGTDVDRDVLESLEAPLNHLLRNAVDHGIEAPGERVAHGKAEQGVIRVEARHHAGMLAITVRDDGRGIDPELLRAKIVARKLLGGDVAARLSKAELLEFIFLPGFSTAGAITEISGRGVGLDAVRSAVEAASGTVRVSSEVRKGTEFLLQLPVTRSVVRAVVADVSGEPYAFPLLRIERIVRAPSASVNSIGNIQYLVVDGINVALISARQLFGIGGGAPVSEDVSVVVLGDEKHRYGLVVDKFLGEHDLVVRPLDHRLGKVQDIAAAAILMDGAPALIVDADDVVRSIEKLAQSGRIGRIEHAIVPARKRKRILVVDDSITVREAERQLLVNRGYDVDVAVDGVDGWNSVRNVPYDLLVVDIDMPRMNGIDLVRTVRADARHAALPIVIVSYKDRKEDRMRGLEAGANHYLTKGSFHDDTLVGVVDELIGGAMS